MNRIDVPVIESAVILIVMNAGARIREDTLAGIYNVKVFPLLRLVLGNAFDLFRVENCVDAMDHPPRLSVFWSSSDACSAVTALFDSELRSENRAQLRDGFAQKPNRGRS